MESIGLGNMGHPIAKNLEKTEDFKEKSRDPDSVNCSFQLFFNISKINGWLGF